MIGHEQKGVREYQIPTLNKYVGQLSYICVISLKLETSCLRVILKSLFVHLLLNASITSLVIYITQAVLKTV